MTIRNAKHDPRRAAFSLAAAAALCLLWSCAGEVVSEVGPGEASADATKDPACIEVCDEAYQICANDCRNHVDNTMCSTECLDKLAHCKRECP